MKFFTTLLRDLTGLAGIASLSYGSWLTYHPAGFMVGGALALAMAVLMAKGEGA